MAVGEAQLEVRLLIDRARKDIDALEKHFASSTKAMDKDAEKVDFKALRKDIDGLEGQLTKVEKKSFDVGKALAGFAAIAAVGFLTRELKLSVEAARDQAQALAQVEAGVKSTGGAAGFTTEALAKMAAGLQRVTEFGDEQILKEATANLLTFTGITEDRFPRAQEAVLDLATRMDTDLKSAAIQVGKALNDPVINLTALSRAGIQFSDDQKEVIKGLVETNRLADAQNLILDELNRQFGGSARAAAEAGSGLRQAANIIGDVREGIGSGFLPVIREMTKQFVESGDSAVESGQKIGQGLGGAANTLIAIFNTAQAGVAKFLAVLTRGVGAIPKTLGFLVEQLQRVANILPDITPGIDETRGILDRLNKSLKENADGIGDQAAAWESLAQQNVEEALAAWETAPQSFKGELGTATTATNALNTSLGEKLPEQADKAKAKIKEVGEQAKATAAELATLAKTDIFGREFTSPETVQKSIAALEDEKKALQGRDQVGEDALATGERLAQIDTELARKKQELRSLELQGIKTADDLVIKQVEQAKTAKDYAEILPQIDKAHADGEISAEAYREALAKINEVQGQVSEGIGSGMGAALEGLNKTSKETTGELREVDGVLTNLAESTERTNEQLDHSEITLKKTGEGWVAWNKAATETLDVLTPLGKEVGDTAEVLDKAAENQVDWSNANVETEKALAEMYQRIRDGKPALEENTEATKEQAEATKGLTESQKAEYDALQKLIDKAKERAQVWQETGTQILEMEAKILAACQATKRCLKT